MIQQRLRRKKGSFIKENFTYFVLFVLLIIFFATVGVKLILDISLYIAGFNDNAKIENQQKASSDVLYKPELYNLPDATNSAVLKIVGSAPKKSDVSIYVNDRKTKSPLQDDNGDFEVKITLSKGENIIYSLIENAENDVSGKSDEYVVYFLDDKPEIVIDSPSEGEIVTTEYITIKGSVSELSSVKINNMPVVISSSGAFSHSLKLQSGENTITISATDIAGNSTSNELKVIYEQE